MFSESVDWQPISSDAAQKNLAILLGNPSLRCGELQVSDDETVIMAYDHFDTGDDDGSDGEAPLPLLDGLQVAT